MHKNQNKILYLKGTAMFFFFYSDGPSTDEIEIHAASLDLTLEEIFQHETEVLKETQETTQGITIARCILFF